jgi:hypothetical protein
MSDYFRPSQLVYSKSLKTLTILLYEEVKKCLLLTKILSVSDAAKQVYFLSGV